ncbi:MAG: hypothetical protein Q8835_03580, partial [Sweet potato little leaf phytoplasma]|nr:hypothetical protein [Sweet potato little leaf phytoplasma]
MLSTFVRKSSNLADLKFSGRGYRGSSVERRLKHFVQAIARVGEETLPEKGTAARASVERRLNDKNAVNLERRLNDEGKLLCGFKPSSLLRGSSPEKNRFPSSLLHGSSP